MSKTIQIDKFGDLTLLLNKPGVTDIFGIEQFKVLVSKDVMRLASPVWATMLQPGRWSEASKNSLAMPEDDPDAMILVLHLAHMNYGQVPTSLYSKLLLKVAILTDKYGLFNLLSLHFGPKWVNQASQALGLTEKAFVFYAFKQEDAFIKHSNMILQTMKVTKGVSDGNDQVEVDGQPVSTDKDYLEAILGEYDSREWLPRGAYQLPKV